MAGWTGLEPATFCVTGRRSNQLSYHPVSWEGKTVELERGKSRMVWINHRAVGSVRRFIPNETQGCVRSRGRGSAGPGIRGRPFPGILGEPGARRPAYGDGRSGGKYGGARRLTSPWSLHSAV